MSVTAVILTPSIGIVLVNQSVTVPRTTAIILRNAA